MTSFLLKPIGLLDKFLSQLAEKSRQENTLPSVPPTIVSEAQSTSKDEFERMVAVLNLLIDKINRNYELSRLWAYQMAHELKTPLSILTLEIEKIAKEKTPLKNANGAEQKIAESIQSITFEKNKMAETINSFLGWAELENTLRPSPVFALRADTLLEGIKARFEGAHPGRLQLQLATDFTVIANPQHIEQVLGLAWVKSICRIYNWDFGVKTDETGSTVTLKL